MNRGLYLKLAFSNIKKNKDTFLPFVLSVTAMIFIVYTLNEMQMQVAKGGFYGDSAMQVILRWGLSICGIFSLFVVIYTNGFLMKQRAREFGLYSMMGMEKKHISMMVFFEIAVVGAVCIVGGMIVGILTSRLMFLILLKILKIKSVMEFDITFNAVFYTAVFFFAVFILVIVLNTIRIYRMHPVELLNSASAGEREPKAKWLLALLGVAAIVIGYYLALSPEDPLDALTQFFTAVLFVIVGTYLLFISGSVAILKLLKQNKKYYYQKNHFITVSGMIYRMKQNAVGLATICLLSTSVLVVLSSTIALYAGMNNVIRTRFPRNVITTYNHYTVGDKEKNIKYDYSMLEPAMKDRAKDFNVKLKNERQYYSYSNIGSLVNEHFSLKDVSTTNARIIEVITLEEYNKRSKTDASLNENEILFCNSGKADTKIERLSIADKTYSVKECIKEFPLSGFGIYKSIGVVVPDLDEMKEICDCLGAQGKESGRKIIELGINFSYDFDLSGDTKDKEAFCRGLKKCIKNTGVSNVNLVENCYTERESFYALYGSLMFIGIFIGAIFLITTVMIIYYKQISEGYDDRRRFQIMQKVGMSEKEVKQAIRSQIVKVFFLPLITAIVHIIFALNIISRILMSLNLSNSSLFIKCVIVTVIVFIAAYVLVYSMTAKAYYRITQRA